MITLYIFLVALFLLGFSILIKSLEIRRGQKIFLAKFFAWSDRVILGFLSQSRAFLRQINFRNAQLIFNWIVVNIRKVLARIKRRFDHKHSPFFSTGDQGQNKNKGAVSFFLKDVSEYKKTLRDGNTDGNVE